MAAAGRRGAAAPATGAGESLLGQGGTWDQPLILQAILVEHIDCRRIDAEMRHVSTKMMISDGLWATLACVHVKLQDLMRGPDGKPKLI